MSDLRLLVIGGAQDTGATWLYQNFSVDLRKEAGCFLRELSDTLNEYCALFNKGASDAIFLEALPKRCIQEDNGIVAAKPGMEAVLNQHMNN